MYVYRYIKEWRKNPKWSFSCCLALLLPLNDLQGEVRGMAGRNILRQQLQTGKIDMPSISGTLKDSGVVTAGLEQEEEEISKTGIPHKSNGETAERPGRKIGKRTRSTTAQSDVTVVSINFARQRTHEIYETAL